MAHAQLMIIHRCTPRLLIFILLCGCSPSLRNAAEQGDAKAQCNLGYAYYTGNGVPKDDVESVKWYRKSAEQGYAKAQYTLGIAYYNGEGVPKDSEKAVEWYRKAAEQGDAGAQRSLGVRYDNGEGVPKDSEKAVEWYRTAAEQGYAAAQWFLGLAYAKVEGVPKDSVTAVKWYRKAAEQGDADAQSPLTIPKWFPTTPGRKLEYRAQSLDDTVLVTVKVVEITHAANLYSATFNVEWRSKESKQDGGVDVEFIYDGVTLSVRHPNIRATISPLSPDSKAGDSITMTIEVQGKEETVDFELKVISTGTKIAIDNGDNRSFTVWDNATVIRGFNEKLGSSFKFVLSAPEGVIRFTGTGQDGLQFIVELLPPKNAVH